MSSNTLIQNRKARHDFTIMETFEAGVVLKGTEVKSIRAHMANLNDSYGTVDGTEVYLHNFHVDPYGFGKLEEQEPLRKKKLLLHAHEIKKLIGEVNQQGYTLVPLSVYLKNGRVKIEMALAKGKKQLDRREEIKKRESDREARAAMKRKNEKWASR